MVEIGPVSADLRDCVIHEPLEQVDHVGRLVDEHAAAFGVPASAPRIGQVIRGSRQLYMVKLPSTGRPILPASIAAFIRRTGSYQRRWLITPSLVWCRRAAASIASQSSRLAASGFSTRTWTPDSAARIAGSACSG